MKIKEFFKKVKSFSLLDFLLSKRRKKLKTKIDLNLDLIEVYEAEIIDFEKAIECNAEMIAELKEYNEKYKSRIKDIEKI